MTNEKNKVKYNLKNVHYAVMSTGEDELATYGTPKPWPGAVNLSLSPEGDVSNFYADGTVYYKSAANNGYSGDLECAMTPDDFSVDVLGETVDETSKVQIENVNAKTKDFALLFEFDGDAKAIKHVLYNCSATRPNLESETINESKEVKTETLSITATALPDGSVKARTTANTTQEVYENWYKKVWEPSEAAE